MTKILNIKIDQKDTIEKTIDNHVNAQNATGNRREWQLHIFNGDNAKIVSHQDGNYYDSKVDVSVFSLDDLFTEKSIDEMPSFNDDYSESRTEFMKIHNLESMNDLDEEMQKEYDALLEAYKENTMSFARSNLTTKDEIESQAGDGSIIATYKIEWV